MKKHFMNVSYNLVKVVTVVDGKLAKPFFPLFDTIFCSLSLGLFLNVSDLPIRFTAENSSQHPFK